MALLDSVKLYCRTDEDVQPLIDAAEGYLTGAGITKSETMPLYILAVEMLVVHWYYNREPVGKADKIAFGLEGIILQLQNTVVVV